MINQPSLSSIVLDVAVAIIRRENEILITKRPEHVPQGGLWEFPGGKQQEGETLEVCLRRELREELGIEVGALRPFQSFLHKYSAYQVVLHSFSCELKKGIPVPRESHEMMWVSPSHLSCYEFPKANGPIISSIVAGKLFPPCAP